MPQKTKTPIKVSSKEKLMEIAKKNAAAIAKRGIDETQWNEAEVYEFLNYADFVEKRIMGINANNLTVEHNINQAAFRLEFVADSPRKKAAEVVTEKFKECYERLNDYSFRQIVLTECERMTNEKEYELPPKEKRELAEYNSACTRELRETAYELAAFENMFSSFFMENAVLPIRPDQAVIPEEAEAEAKAFRAINAALPEGPEYDVFRTRAGYANERPLPMEPTIATLVMNPNVLTTDITVEDFPASIRKEHPSNINLEWGADTFDNMLETLYNQDEWKMLHRDKMDLLRTVYLDGKPVQEVYPEKKNESKRDYERRVKCELVANLLEGKGKLDVTPYRVVDGNYTVAEPVPVQAKVNLPEKVSAWKRFLRFFNIKVELKKEKAERLSREDLYDEDRREAVRRDSERMMARENTSSYVREKVEAAQENTNRANLDFFGFLEPGANRRMSPRQEADYLDRLNKKVMGLQNAKISPEVAEALGKPDMKTVNVAKTMERIDSRTSLVRMFAISKGMSLEDVLSPDPALREQKETIGREFMDIISVKGSEEFHKENGPDADYKAYFAEKSQNMYNMLVSLHQTMADLPFDYFKGSSPKDLADSYEKMSFVSAVSQDLFQCCPPEVKAIDFDRLQKLEVQGRSLGELRSLEDYCSDYVATDAYAKCNLAAPQAESKMVTALCNKLKSESLVADTAGITRLGDLHTVLGENWAFPKNLLMAELSSHALSDPDLMKDIVNQMEKDGKPVYYFDADKKEYVHDRAEKIEKLQAQKNAREQTKSGALNFKDLDGGVKKRTSIKLDDKQKTAQKAPVQKKGPQLQ